MNDRDFMRYSRQILLGDIAIEGQQKLLDGQSEFVLEGPTYARAKPCAEKTLTDWYNKKNFSIYHEEKLAEEIYSPVLEERLLAGYRFLIPFYRYFMTLDGDADPREA